MILIPIYIGGFLLMAFALHFGATQYVYKEMEHKTKIDKGFWKLFWKHFPLRFWKIK